MNENRGKPHKSSLLNILSWVLGAASLLNLAKDIGQIAVYGKLKTWLSAYSTFVAEIGGFLFGWINWAWFSISDIELHILILAGIFTSAFIRADYYTDEFKDKNPDIVASIFVGLFCFSFAFVPAILFPGYWGGILSALGFVFFAFISITNSEEDERMPSGKLVLAELVGISAVFLVIIALNFSVFNAETG